MTTITRDIKVWESNPVGFASFRDKLMAFCYDHHVAPDDVNIAPYVDVSPCGSIIATGIRLTVEKNSE